VRDDGIPEAAYRAALVADLESALPQIWGRRVHSIFIGGGTPSLISPDGLDELLTAIRMRVQLDRWPRSPSKPTPAPSTAAASRPSQAGGVNRLSVGIQSFDERHLQALGRIHGRADAIAAAEAALTHFEAVNLDLMYALPGQTLAEAEADLATAPRPRPRPPVLLPPDPRAQHRLRRQPARVPDPDASADMQDRIEARLAGRLPPLRNLRLRQARPRMPAQPQLLDLRRLPRHRRRRPRQAVVPRRHRARSPPQHPPPTSPPTSRAASSPNAAASAPPNCPSSS
jgi:oxygen-independent coproporphyrinogen-3 oxidase